MIIRIYRGTVFAGKERAWQTVVEQQGISWLRSQKGLVAFHPGRPLDGSGERVFCMVMVWESVDAIATAIGSDWKAPIYPDDSAKELIESSSVEHFELYS